MPYQFPVFHLVIGLALATAPGSLVVGRLLDTPPIAWLARISFGIYVWHYVVLELVRLYVVPDMVQGGLRDPMVFLLASALVTAITIAIAALSWYWLERPAIDWARGLEKHGRFRPALA